MKKSGAKQFTRVKIGRYKTRMGLLAMTETLLCSKESIRLYRDLQPLFPAMDKNILRAMAENAALASFCLYKGSKLLFASGREAADALTPGELALVATIYRKLRRRLLGRREQDRDMPVPLGKVLFFEEGINTRFSEVAKEDAAHADL